MQTFKTLNATSRQTVLENNHSCSLSGKDATMHSKKFLVYAFSTFLAICVLLLLFAVLPDRQSPQTTFGLASKQTKSATNSLLEMLGSRHDLPISEAIKIAKNDSTSVKELISKGANVNVKDSQGYSPLFLASSAGFEDIVEILLANGANPDLSTNDGWTPLMVASESGNIDIVKMLINHHANINLKNHDGWSALKIASRWENKVVLQTLEMSGAKE
jgi:hypothetical protein